MQPKIELRKVKHSRSLSEETPAYTAEIWVDGVLFCAVSNHGTGGPDMHYPPKGMAHATFDPLLMALEARIAETFPKIDVSDMYDKPAGSELMDMSLETLCGQLLADREMAQMLKRDLAKKILFVKKGDGLHFVKKPPGQEAQMIAILKEKYGACVHVLNEMPFEEALRVYSTAA